MNATGPWPVIEIAPGPSADAPDVVDSIGTPDFAGRVLSLLNRVSGADHLAVFELEHDRPVTVSLDGTELAQKRWGQYLASQYWRQDPVIGHMRQSPGLVAQTLRVDLARMADPVSRELLYGDIDDRLVVFGLANGHRYGLSILRSRQYGVFSRREIDSVARMAGVLVAATSKHVQVSQLQVRRSPSTAFESLAAIEATLSNDGQLTARQVQICARTLYGMSALGIARDLSVSEESVKTYRKRAYQRLGLGSARELTIWYLRLWEAPQK